MKNKKTFYNLNSFSVWLIKKVFKDDDGVRLGDFNEIYNDLIEEKGRLRARFFFWFYVMMALPQYLKDLTIWSTAMLLNYMKIAYRNIKRHKGYSLINITGLAVGISCFLLIFLYVQNELTYDSYHENSDRIYRISSTYITSGEPIRFASSSPALGPRLKDEFPEVEEYVRILRAPRLLFRQQDSNVSFYENNIVVADPSIFNVFSYEFLQGDPVTCLDDPKTIVLTEVLADKYFGKENPMGKALSVDGEYFIVTGVIKSPPQNSHLTIEGIASFLNIPEGPRLYPSMFEILGFTYVLLPENYDFAGFTEKWPAFYEKYCAEDAALYGQVFEPNFVKLTDIRYGSLNFRFDVPVGSDLYLFAFISIGLFILALACINFINMTTAQAPTRAKEIGIRKVLGSDRQNLIFQILIESYFITFLAFASAYVIMKLSLLYIPIEQMLGFNIEMNFQENSLLLVSTLVLYVFISLISGLYPAFYMTSVLPVKALSGTLKSGKSGLFTRRVLVTSQFAISIGVVVLMLFVNDQVDFMRNQNLGFHKENIVSIQIRDRSVTEILPALMEEFSKYPGVISVTSGSNLPGRPSSGLYWFEGNEGTVEHNYSVFMVGYDYNETLGLEITKGRDFDRSFTSDTSKAVIVNETLVKTMKWKDPIGKRITQSSFQAEVVGVVKDFNFRSLHNEIEPLLLRMRRRPGGRLIMKIEGRNIVHTMSLIEEKWNSISPDRPFEYSFLDEEFGRLYNEDQRLNKLIKLFSVICVLISCLGVLGLSSFNSIRRTKEVAIRKVHGASTYQIVRMLFREIFLLFLTASLIIFPVSLILINLWLENFAYRTEINLMLFLGTVIAGVLVALFTAGYHSIKVASENPVKRIRHE